MGELILFPFGEINKDDTVIIYGMGELGRQYVKQVEVTGYCNIICAVDRNWDKISCANVKIQSPETLKSMEFDKIVIACMSPMNAAEIKSNLIGMGIAENKIVYKKCDYTPDVDPVMISQELTSIRRNMVNMWLMLYSIDSYCQNEFYMKNDGDFTQYPLYQFLQKEKVLLNVKEIQGDHKFVRVGNQSDGGYIMLDDMEDLRIAYSFGIGPDTSWDKDMATRGFQIFQYDPTISELPYQDKNFHFKRIGICGNQPVENCMTLEKIIELDQHMSEKDMILKMDVEEAEWDFLNEVNEDILKKFKQIVFEMHGCERVEMKDRILPALEKLNRTHQCVYVHSNNYGAVEYMGDINMPYALETTWVRKTDYQFKESKKVFPTEIDQRCFSERRENIFGEWNQ